MNNNLVPKVITDKNGVITTRMVKPDTDNATAKSMIPPVAVPKPLSKTGLQDELSDIFNQCDPDSINVEGIQETLPHLSHETLEAIASNVRGDADARDVAALWIDMYGGNETYLRELFCYRDAFDPSTDYSFMEEAVHYLHQYDELPDDDDYSKADEALKQTIYDLLAVTETMIAEDYEMQREGNDPILPADLRKLIIDRPDDLDRINQIILENPGVRSGEQIAMMLDSDAPAIAQGIL